MNRMQTVFVLGDSDTASRADMLAEKAAEKGVTIAQVFAFGLGDAGTHDDLTEVDEVVAALSRAIASRTPIWCPFPLDDLRREQHSRRLSLALQRHGLNLLVGPDLEPSPIDGGYHEVDAALRKEVHAVDDLDNAALAVAGLRTLGVEIEAELTRYPTWDHDDLVHAWWVVPGRLLAGEYPGDRKPKRAALKIRTLIAAGVDSFVDLTEAGELTWGGAPMVRYDDRLPARYARFPIPDRSTIDDAGYDEILAYIRAEMRDGRVVYLHCWGGKGRTGTVVGSWLIARDGLDYPQVLARLATLRTGTRKASARVPETAEQEGVLRRRALRAGARP